MELRYGLSFLSGHLWLLVDVGWVLEALILFIRGNIHLSVTIILTLIEVFDSAVVVGDRCCLRIKTYMALV